MYIHTYVHNYLSLSLYIYIYRERKRDLCIFVLFARDGVGLAGVVDPGHSEDVIM